MAEDGSKKIWWIFFLLGMGTLLPWNFFITPFNYWMEKLELNQTENGTRVEQTYQAFWGSTMALATMSTNFVMCFITTVLMNIISRNIRFLVPIVGIGICFAIAAVYTTLTMEVPAFFAQTMFNVVIITAFCAVLQSSLFGHGAEVGEVMSAIMGGQGVGGVLASLTDIAAKLIFANDADAAMIFFAFPSVFMIVTGMAYMYLQKLPEYRDKIAPRETSEKEKVELNENENEAFIEGSGEKSIKSVIFDTENGILKYMFCVWFCFLITLGLFPAVLMGVQSVNYDYSLTEADEGYSTFYSRFYLTLSVFFLFNLTDTIGRMSSEYFTRPKSALNIIKPHQPNRLVALCVARLVLVILMPKCNIFAGVRSEDAIWFKSDFIFIVLMVIFGISNGLFSSIAMAYAPQRAPEFARERVGGFMGTILVGGLFSGALISYALVGMTKRF